MNDEKMQQEEDAPVMEEMSDDDFESGTETMIESERFKPEASVFNIPWVERMSFPDEPGLVST